MRRTPRLAVQLATSTIALVVLAACASDPSTVAPPTSRPAAADTTAPPVSAAATSTSTTSAPTTTTIPTSVADAPSDPALREELLEMLSQDQAVRTGEAPPGDDRTPDELFAAMDEVDEHNQSRLQEIFDEHGWPGWSLVGKDGSTAAWAIVQHADLDLEFQERGLELLREAVEAGDASPGDLAYLTDRVLVAKGEEQEYGTQWGMDEDGRPEPRTPIRDEANVDERRAAAGLSTLAEYMEELAAAFGPPDTAT